MFHPSLKRDISRNNNRIISIIQRWPLANINVHLSADEWRKKISAWEKKNKIPTLLPISELKRIELMVDELPATTSIELIDAIDGEVVSTDDMTVDLGGGTP